MEGREMLPMIQLGVEIEQIVVDANDLSPDFRPPHSLTLTQSKTAVADTNALPEQVNIPI
jgi:hypothetical protein